MAKSALIICNFRLRNTDRFNEIIDKFKKNKYDIYDFGEIEKDSFDIKSLEEKIKEIDGNDKKYENISVISNIRDIIFIWYRVYNKLIDNFIFYIDKVNYNILKRVDNSEVLEKIAEFKGIYQEELKGKIYINIDYNNYEQMFEFLFKDFKFRYFDSLENFNYLRKKECIVEEIKKSYLYKEKEINFLKEKTEKKINLEKEYEDDKSKFFEYIEQSEYFYPYYVLFIIKNYSGNEAREILIKNFEQYIKKEEVIKEKIANILIDTNGFEKLEFIEKIGILSINFGIEINKNEYFLDKVVELMLQDKGKNAKYYYHILNNLNLKNFVVNNKEYYEKKKKIMDLMDAFYKEKIDINYQYIGKNKKIMFIVDSLETKSYSGTKFLFDIVENLLKKDETLEIVIYCEENFFGIQEENPIIFDYNNRTMYWSDIERKMEKYAESIGNVKVIYSDIYKKKEERIKEVVDFTLQFSPKAILTTTIFSNSINLLYENFPIINLSLGGINSLNKFDIYLYPHLQFIINMFPENILKYDKERMFSFDYSGDFEKSETVENREKFHFNEEDFILISVGVRLGVDINEGIAAVLLEFIRNKKNVKWLIVGETDIPSLDNKCSERDREKIVKIKYLGNLPEVYRMCDLYINPPRLGGGFSMAEAIANDLCVITPAISAAGVLHCGIENSSKNLNEFKNELYKIYEDISYKENKLKKEKNIQESLSLKNVIPKLFDYIDEAIKLFRERKGI